MNSVSRRQLSIFKSQLSPDLTSHSLAAEWSSLVSTLGLVNIPLESPEFPIAAPPMGSEENGRDQYEAAYLA